MLARVSRAGAALVILCTLGVLGTPPARRAVADFALHGALAGVARSPGQLTARLNAPASSVFSDFPFSSQARGFAIASALQNAKNDRSAEAQDAAGVAALLSGDTAAATRYLNAATRAGNDATYWTHLAAALYESAVKTNNDEDLLSSLGASERALRLNPRSPEAMYNFALAVEQLGLTPAAQELWRAYLAVDSEGQWSDDARRRLQRAASHKTQVELWKEQIGSAMRDDAALESLARQYPEQARGWAERTVLGEWAEALRRREYATAQFQLSRVRIVASLMKRTFGDTFLDDVVACIDETIRTNDEPRLEALIKGQLLFQAGGQLIRAEDYATAATPFDHSASTLLLARSPMAIAAAMQAASALHSADRVTEASARVDRLLAIEDSTTHYSVRAQLHYQRARADATRAFWSESIDSAKKALTLYEQTEERGRRGMTTTLIAEAYGYLGQPAIAVRESIAAIRLSAEAGDTHRLRVTSANLCREFIRREQWDTAHAWIRIERILERLNPDFEMTTDTCMRAALVAYNLGQRDGAEYELGEAYRRADAAEPALRASLVADIDGARGAILRRTDPASAVQYLQKAIAYQESTSRAPLLPQLYLELARAQLALHKTDLAANAFERGIVQLEQQRSHVAEPALRNGIFDDSHELFAEALILDLQEQKPEAAFAVLERGRARALLEQIAGDPSKIDPVPTIDFVRRNMPRDTLLIEYAVLRDRLVLFLIAHDLFTVREIPITATAVTAMSNAFIDALVERRPIDEVLERAAEMHRLLIPPASERSRYANLVLVPDAALQQFPFSATYDREKRMFLMQQHLLVGAPSTAVFLTGRARRTAQYRTAAVFSGTIVDRTLMLRGLPETDREADLVAQIYQPAVLVRGKDASVERFLAEAPKYDVLHFAGHALIDGSDPSQSALVFSTQKNGVPAFLRCREIGKTSFRRSRLVVLAACSTMRGRTGHTDGTPSIARSFLAAGVPVVLGTLWDIEDNETATLITDFHKNVARNMSPAAALRAAQLAALHDDYAAARHPGSWAAFALLGAGI